MLIGSGRFVYMWRKRQLCCYSSAVKWCLARGKWTGMEGRGVESEEKVHSISSRRIHLSKFFFCFCFLRKRFVVYTMSLWLLGMSINAFTLSWVCSLTCVEVSLGQVVSLLAEEHMGMKTEGPCSSPAPVGHGYYSMGSLEHSTHTTLRSPPRCSETTPASIYTVWIHNGQSPALLAVGRNQTTYHSDWNRYRRDDPFWI